MFTGIGIGLFGRGSRSGNASLALRFDGSSPLDSRINFSRTTNATVTNSAGLITYAPHNLIVNSENLDNSTWTKINVTISANSVAAPDGTMTADLVSASGTGSHYVSRTTGTTGNTTCFSVYVKANEGRYVQLTAPYNSGTYFNFDSLTGEFGNIGGLVSNTQAQSVGNGWWRVSGVFNNTSLASDIWRVYLAESNTSAFNSSFTVTTPVSVYVWGAQLEVGASPTAYNPTTVKNLLGYSELFDNAAWTKSNSFVQTNLLTYSELFDNAAWTKLRTTVTANSVLAPNGYQTADSILQAAGQTTVGQVSQTVNAVVSPYVLSVYVKPAGKNYIILSENIGTGSARNTWFNISTGTVGTTNAGHTATITPAENGYYRCSIALSVNLIRSGQVLVYVADADNSTTVVDDTLGIYAWGAQLVQGSVAGDYRRTDAAALPVYYPNHNGVVCAEKIVETTANNFHFITEVTTKPALSGIYTYSFYAKKAENDYVWVQVSDGAGNGVTTAFNLITGAVSSAGATTGTGFTFIGSSITSAGNGYFRVSLTVSSNAATSIASYIGNTDNGTVQTYTGDGTSGIYIFGAQLSDSASLDPYVLNAAAAPTAAAYYGARFDYDPVTLQPKGLLIEEQRVNYLLQSEDFSSVSWSKSNLNAFGSGSTINATAAPDGNITADKITPSATSAPSLTGSYTSATPSSAYTASVYVKTAGVGFAYLQMNGVTGTTVASFVSIDLSNGTLGTITALAGGGLTNASATSTSVANGFYRITLTGTIGAGNTTVTVSVGITDAQNTRTGTISTTNGIFIWGSQLEAGAFATSYIPTAASQVTRAADVALMQGSNFYSWWNNNEGSLFANYSAAISGRYILSVRNAALTADRVVLWTNGFVAGTGGSFTDIVLIAKRVGAYKHNDAAMATNNVLNGTDTSVTIDYPAEAMAIGSSNGSATVMNGTIKSISYFPQRLSDSVLKGLTA